MRRCKTEFSVVSLLAQFLIQSVNPRARHPPRGHAPDQTSSSLLAHSDLIEHKGVQILLSPKINQSLRRPNSFSSSEAIRVPALQEGAGLVKPGQLAHNTCWRRTRTTTEELWASSTQKTNAASQQQDASCLCRSFKGRASTRSHKPAFVFLIVMMSFW